MQFIKVLKVFLGKEFTESNQQANLFSIFIVQSDVPFENIEARKRSKQASLLAFQMPS
jgi:hypothetical protein